MASGAVQSLGRLLPTIYFSFTSCPQPDPGVDKAMAFGDVFAEAIEESDFVLVVFEDGRSVDPANHDVMQGTGPA